jgi:hypothetical protein
MSDERKKRSRTWIGWAFLAAIVLYPLSTGPAYLLLFKPHRISPQTWTTVYTPIKWLTDSYDPLRALLTWYLRLWGSN